MGISKLEIVEAIDTLNGNDPDNLTEDMFNTWKSNGSSWRIGRPNGRSNRNATCSYKRWICILGFTCSCMLFTCVPFSILALHVCLLAGALALLAHEGQLLAKRIIFPNTQQSGDIQLFRLLALVCYILAYCFEYLLFVWFTCCCANFTCS
ncbi:hypothetical protein MKY37_01855 [Psychrobacillus sp. FSL K6-2836]|uniref:hypothetical protein n=1 Tax=Psychrobacillus sp. FSL K6-2836 TaxID=2921548 RepID=UPI0030FB0522